MLRRIKAKAMGPVFHRAMSRLSRPACARIAAAALGCAALGACATTTAPPEGQGDKVARAVEQPMRDLSLIREAPAPALILAWKSPYQTGGKDNCASLKAELAGLDAALGPDVAESAKPDRSISPTGLAADAVGGAVGLPFRGIVRTVTGAESRDRQLHAAVLAGMVRRAFLKGRLHEMACAAPAQPVPPAPKVVAPAAG
ncbi:MAG: hypothetical protein KGO51_05635 [Alphaproteobacteria bacterium]|nr:hypothetical protein [Alphaproteobacteria bacterium]